MSANELEDPDLWCALSFTAKREVLAEALREALAQEESIREVVIEAGSMGRESDFTAAVETDVGRLRTPLWSHARATVFCDPSIHAANRRQLAPAIAVAEAADRLRRRLSVPFALESRGLTITVQPEEGVERVWLAERSLFRNRTVVSREDRIANAAADIDLRDLLSHFYSGPSLRLVGEGADPFLLPGGTEAEGPLVSLCPACSRWFPEPHENCPACGAATDIVVAARPPGRTGR